MVNRPSVAAIPDTDCRRCVAQTVRSSLTHTSMGTSTHRHHPSSVGTVHLVSECRGFFSDKCFRVRGFMSSGKSAELVVASHSPCSHGLRADSRGDQ